MLCFWCESYLTLGAFSLRALYFCGCQTFFPRKQSRICKKKGDMQLSDQLSSLPDVRFKPIFSASRLKIHFQEYIWFVQKIKETNLQFLIVVEFCASAIELKIGSELYSPATILFEVYT